MTNTLRPWTFWTGRGRERYESTCLILRHMPDPWPFDIASRLERYGKTGVLPDLEPVEPFDRNVALPKMAAFSVTPNVDLKFLRILRPLSQDGTTQGTVFECEAFSNSTGRSSRLALKKSLVPQIGDWKCYLGRLAKLATTECRARLHARADRDNESVAPEELARRRILERWTAPTTEHLVDSVASATLSDLVLTGISPFHPLCYGTFRCYDTAWWDSPCHVRTHVSETGRRQVASSQDGRRNGVGAENQKDAPRISSSSAFLDVGKPERDPVWNEVLRKHPPPVQLVAQEVLDGTVRSLVKAEFFGTGLGFRWDVLHSFLAQIAWGLAIAQRECGFVNNDAHWSNLMFRRSDPDAFLRYAELDENDKVVRCHDVPTRGFVLALVDPGRSSFRALGTTFRSEYVPEPAKIALVGRPDPELKFDNPSADLVRTSWEVAALLRSARVVDANLKLLPNACLESNRTRADAVLELCLRWRTVRDETRNVDFDLESYRRHVDDEYARREPTASQERRAEIRALAQHEAYVWAPIYKDNWTWNAVPSAQLPAFDSHFGVQDRSPDEELDSNAFVLRTQH